jgi:hypothetical protein
VLVRELYGCWKCGGLNFWRSRDSVIHCAHCEPAKAHYIIAERLRAVPGPLSALERAIAFLRAELKSSESKLAKAVIDTAYRAKIAPATLTRARWKLGLRSVKTRRGWLWVRQSR